MSCLYEVNQEIVCVNSLIQFEPQIDYKHLDLSFNYQSLLFLMVT